jgi:hypothetical protein
MQQIEDSALDDAVRLGLVDSIEERELRRIREDRNLVVHPSLKNLGEQYVPRLESARAHIATALDVLLIHPPIQGKTVIEHFLNHICEESFTPTGTFMLRTFYENVKESARRNLVTLATKHAVGELEVPDRAIAHTAVADRMAKYLVTVAERDREVVTTAIKSCAALLSRQNRDTTLRVVARLGDQDFFWSGLDEALIARINDLVGTVEVPDSGRVSMHADILSLAGNETARSNLPKLISRFEVMPWTTKIASMITRPSTLFTPYIAQLFGETESFNGAGMLYGAIFPHYLHLIDLEGLRNILSASGRNPQIYLSRYTPDFMPKLFAATKHLGEDRWSLFDTFIDTVRPMTDNDYYQYHDLEAELASERGERQSTP